MGELNLRCTSAVRFNFFDDEEGEAWLMHETEDLHIVCRWPQSQVLPDFQKAGKYTGPVQGMVFKTGKQGTGFTKIYGSLS